MTCHCFRCTRSRGLDPLAVEGAVRLGQIPAKYTLRIHRPPIHGAQLSASVSLGGVREFALAPGLLDLANGLGGVADRMEATL